MWAARACSGADATVVVGTGLMLRIAAFLLFSQLLPIDIAE